MVIEAACQSRIIARPILSALLGLFLFRVLAQGLQWLYPVSWLGEFSTWHSGLLPYPVLLGSQAMILIWGILAIRNLAPAGTCRSTSAKGYLLFGTIYLLAMLFRLMAGYGNLSENPWFNAPLPTLFHIALALFLLTLGLHKRGRLLPAISRAAYPLILLAAICGNRFLAHLNADIPTTTLVPVLLVALLIMLLERNLSYRKQWHPRRSEVVNDLAYMILIQQVLPRAFGFVAAWLILVYGSSLPSVATEWWPHQWPVSLQTMAILLLVEFFRYWVHRIAHRWGPLWRLHAVHHSPGRLYWLNVGRFHPIEKILQLLFDTLPFLVLGISPEVFSMYYVCYAVHGLFQHSNIDLKMGWLNWVFSGPELHRWHHSRIPAESDHNFGNTLIIWDTLFGTRYLPDDKEVDDLGLRNEKYPMGFAAQLFCPFIRDIDQRPPENHP